MASAKVNNPSIGEIIGRDRVGRGTTAFIKALEKVKPRRSACYQKSAAIDRDPSSLRLCHRIAFPEPIASRGREFTPRTDLAAVEPETAGSPRPEAG